MLVKEPTYCKMQASWSSGREYYFLDKQKGKYRSGGPQRGVPGTLEPIILTVWSPNNSHAGALEPTVLSMGSSVTQKLQFVKTKQEIACIYLGKLYE